MYYHVSSDVVVIDSEMCRGCRCGQCVRGVLGGRVQWTRTDDWHSLIAAVRCRADWTVLHSLQGHCSLLLTQLCKLIMIKLKS